MKKITINLPGGVTETLPSGVSVQQAIASLDESLIKSAVAARVDGKLVDINHGLAADASVEPILITSKEGLEILRHSISHIMAQAVKDLFPSVKVTIGPSIEDGFYYDFDYEGTFTTEDLVKIEKRMAEIVAEDKPFMCRMLPMEEAISFFEEQGENYKVELLRDLPEDVSEVSLYSQGNFVDLCRGPHIPSTGLARAFKLLSVAGAYWRGDERNTQLQRIYGTGFPTKEELDHHLMVIEEAKKRDHRKLGRELDLFQVNDEVGPGLIIFHPKGALLRSIIEDWERKEHLKRGYGIVMGPQILKGDLWKKSGHFDHYRENMYYTDVDEQLYGIKPMNCLSHMLIYKSKIRSYRDLPIRYFELGTVHRHEKTGVLHGLMRVRQFTQDDAHILCTPDQLNDEIKAIVGFVDDAMNIFGFEYEVELSTRPDKSIGSDEEWDLATTALKKVLDDTGLEHEINEGDGAFYGPKIDFKLKDALGRKWQCATIQCDFTLPDRFDLSYVGPDGEKHRPVMLHRVILGAIERFMGVLIEHYAGAFPLWLSPVQALIVTVTDRHIPYGEKVLRELIEAGVRAEGDFRNEKLGYKIREGQLQKIPYMLVIGDREVESRTLAPRQRDGKTLDPLSVDSFILLVSEKSRNYQ
ncbi:MAG: threonine--tRNA ligase [Syntrophales bacterium]|nr:threonine--tRNA ligase [Syntrophales bacterium]